MSSLFLFSCATRQVEPEPLRIVGYGVGESANMAVGLEKAKIAAMANLAQQMSGIDFRYDAGSGDLEFTTRAAAVVESSRIVQQQVLGNDRYLAVIETMIPATGYIREAVNHERHLEKHDIGEALNDAYLDAIESQLGLSSGLVEGRIFLNKLEATPVPDTSLVGIDVGFYLFFMQ
jgi:hypothetical protein